MAKSDGGRPTTRSRSRQRRSATAALLADGRDVGVNYRIQRAPINWPVVLARSFECALNLSTVKLNYYYSTRPASSKLFLQMCFSSSQAVIS